MKKTLFNPSLFVWVPAGLATGVKPEDLAWVHTVLVIVALWFVLDKVLTRQRR